MLPKSFRFLPFASCADLHENTKNHARIQFLFAFLTSGRRSASSATASIAFIIAQGLSEDKERGYSVSINRPPPSQLPVLGTTP